MFLIPFLCSGLYGGITNQDIMTGQALGWSWTQRNLAVASSLMMWAGASANNIGGGMSGASGLAAAGDNAFAFAPAIARSAVFAEELGAALSEYGGRAADVAALTNAVFQTATRDTGNRSAYGSGEARAKWNNGWRTANGKFASPNGEGIPGEAAVDDFVANARANGVDVVATRVSVRSPFSDNGIRQIDVVIRDPITGELHGIEIKSSDGAFTRFDEPARQQFAGDRWFNDEGAEVVGYWKTQDLDRIASTTKIVWKAGVP